MVFQSVVDAQQRSVYPPEPEQSRLPYKLLLPHSIAAASQHFF
jgi:hypothetical protein